ncbi:MAG: hypothetical protein DRZ90_16555 [Spirochaetes bacterium]|nr:MAG: hypothetical protein DRZ90_16555 [Spirochaetota bacterium]
MIYTFDMNRIFITDKVLLKSVIIPVLFLLISLSAFAEEDNYNPDLNFAQVKSVRLVYRADGRWDVHVAVRHNDEGWGHYADVWQVVDSDTGDVVGERILAHPHDTEQPFTRSLTGLVIPGKVRNIRIRSRCSLHDYGGREISFRIPEDLKKGAFSTVLN